MMFVVWISLCVLVAPSVKGDTTCPLEPGDDNNCEGCGATGPCVNLKECVLSRNHARLLLESSMRPRRKL